MIILLPFPPSTNGLFAGKSRRFKSKAYNKWLEEAHRAMDKQKPLPYTTNRVDLVFKLNGGRANSDCSNYIKAAEDLLVSYGCIFDDSKEYVRSVRAEWSDDVQSGVQIEIYEVKE